MTWPDEIDPDSHFAMASIPGSISIATIIIAIALAVSLLFIIGEAGFRKAGLAVYCNFGASGTRPACIKCAIELA